MTIDELNRRMSAPDADEFIRVCEARQVKRLTALADTICARPSVRVVLLAGASSAGKTTTAKRLATQLRVNGRAAIHLSTDDYFVGDSRNPRDENGEFDYEHLDCVDRARLVSDMARLLKGETVHPRRFDFLRHEGYDAESTVSLPADGYVVLEGIHALNPQLAAGLPPEALFRIYVDPQPSLEILFGKSLRSEEARLLRRLVRDNQFRKVSPLETFRLWPKVLAGEEKWIKPHRALAEATFDSSLDYELSVLKPFVQGLLTVAHHRHPDEPLVLFLLDLLKEVRAVSPNAVPGDSILRETIGGSQLSY